MSEIFLLSVAAALNPALLGATTVMLTLDRLPGGAYLAGLGKIAKQDASTPSTVLLIVGFNVVMLILLEVPLIGYAFSPDRTARAVDRFTAWLARDGGKVALIVAVVIGIVLTGRGIVELVA